MSALALLHADAHLVVVDKPSGLPAVPGRPQALKDCVASRVQAHFADALVVHRLDQATSGVLLFARGAATQRALSGAFAQREVRKDYIAIVHGLVARDEGEIDLPIGADWAQRPKRIVDHDRGAAALTRWRVIERDVARGTTRLALQPHTGRTHQLRVHLAAIGHPIVGDTLYGRGDGAPRLMLHARALGFAHPGSGAAFTIEAPLPF